MSDYPKRAKTPIEKHNEIFKLYLVWLKNPDLRLGQLIYNALGDKDLHYCEDSELIETIIDYYEKN